MSCSVAACCNSPTDRKLHKSESDCAPLSVKVATVRFESGTWVQSIEFLNEVLLFINQINQICRMRVFVAFLQPNANVMLTAYSLHQPSEKENVLRVVSLSNNGAHEFAARGG
jgi:hypothetical protein